MNNAAEVTSLKGKNTRKSANPVVKEYMQVPHLIMNLNKKLILPADAMFVNVLIFFFALHGGLNSTHWSKSTIVLKLD